MLEIWYDYTESFSPGID